MPAAEDGVRLNLFKKSLQGILESHIRILILILCPILQILPMISSPAVCM
jgi:hypothetical protein